jgi:hypothetical protein
MEDKYKYDESYIIDDESADKWHTGQFYEDVPAKQLKCSKCGGNEFNVAQAHCWTGIKCPRCGWESDIHEG